ncbi:MAG: nickel pincer cofactor biosynthesis protein LarC [Spirochaetaceae bacterium]|jgi:uncharacterized protein (TIGR00299 family) protein|nr:nickel pincer cofactor biosynthesis protein LarC [Spirochaetaceae bacterium]
MDMSRNDKNRPAGQRCLHFECFAGISGDMALGALVDLGADREALAGELAKLPVDGWKLEFHRDSRGGIYGIHPVVVMADGSTEHVADDADDGAATGTAIGLAEEHGGHHGHYHGGHHEHHQHEHHHGETGGHHEHRQWKDIRKMIADAPIRNGAKEYALKIFSVLAEAEAEVHGTAVGEVTFHEVGAVDSIIDIVGTAVCLDLLAPDRITCGAVELGGGMARCAHGILPVPAPAVLKLCRGMPCTTGGFDKEMTTPTGAAILRACVDEFVTESAFVQIKEGIGIGTRKMARPNFLRVSLRDTDAGNAGGNDKPGDGPSRDGPPGGGSSGKLWFEEKLYSLECNIDDMTGEDFGFLQERLFQAGALDAAFVPCTMKKNRPGIIVQVLCRRENLDAVRLALFTKSTTIGFRETAVNRLSLRREEAVIDTADGPARVKKVYLGDEFLRQKIEYEDRVKHER